MYLFRNYSYHMWYTYVWLCSSQNNSSAIDERTLRTYLQLLICFTQPSTWAAFYASKLGNTILFITYYHSFFSHPLYPHPTSFRLLIPYLLFPCKWFGIRRKALQCRFRFHEVIMDAVSHTIHGLVLWADFFIFTQIFNKLSEKQNGVEKLSMYAYYP